MQVWTRDTVMSVLGLSVVVATCSLSVAVCHLLAHSFNVIICKLGRVMIYFKTLPNYNAFENSCLQICFNVPWVIEHIIMIFPSGLTFSVTKERNNYNTHISLYRHFSFISVGRIIDVPLKNIIYIIWANWSLLIRPVSWNRKWKKK